MVLIRAFPRMHISLLDLGNATGRRYGGAGFNIDGFCTEVSAVATATDEIEGSDLIDADARNDVDRVLLALRSYRPNLPAMRISIRSVPPQHVGFGTKTALLLAILSAANLETCAELTPAELKRLSGRGGASGVGINLFFEGGFVCDLGHPNNHDIGFQPSSLSHTTEVPPIACRWKLPEMWRILLILPPGKRLSGVSEAAFFRETTPLPRTEVLEAVAAMYHGVLPAIITAELGLLGSSLRQLHNVGFKRLELEAQSESVKQAYRRFASMADAATGLSSLGPLLYVIVHRNDSETIAAVEHDCAERGLLYMGLFDGHNNGHEVIHA